MKWLLLGLVLALGLRSNALAQDWREVKNMETNAIKKAGWALEVPSNWVPVAVDPPPRWPTDIETRPEPPPAW